MNNFPLFETTYLLDCLPIRVSTQCLRQRNYPHIHEHMQICYVLSGTLKHTIEGHEYIQSADSCSFILPYMNHMTNLVDSEDTPIVVFISFWDKFLTDFGYDFFPFFENRAHFENRRIPRLCEFTGEKKEKARTCVHSMINEFSNENDIPFSNLAKLLAELLDMSCTDAAKGSVSRVLKQRVMDTTKAVHYITENYSKKINIDDTARLCNMSRSTLTQNLKALTNLSFVDFVTSVRLSYASKLWLTTDMLLEEIAEQCGLNSRTNLTRVFQKFLGVSPTKFRENRLISSYKERDNQNLILNWLFEDE